MPLSDLHKRKKTKNFIFLGLIFAWIALIWYVTVIKIERLSNGVETEHATTP